MIKFTKLFKGLYKRCECGQKDCIIPVINKIGKFARYKTGHNSKGMNHPSWKGGRTTDKDGYILLLMPDYFSSNKIGYVREHIYNYQEYYKCCLLSWSDIHHIDRNKGNNMVWNLQGMMGIKHHEYHMKDNSHALGKHIDTTGRCCYSCCSKTTYIQNPSGNHRTPRQRWYHLPWDKINWYCARCYQRLR